MAEDKTTSPKDRLLSTLSKPKPDGCWVANLPPDYIEAIEAALAFAETANRRPPWQECLDFLKAEGVTPIGQSEGGMKSVLRAHFGSHVTR